jgi:hypothetical protein
VDALGRLAEGHAIVFKGYIRLKGRERVYLSCRQHRKQDGAGAREGGKGGWAASGGVASQLALAPAAAPTAGAGHDSSWFCVCITHQLCPEVPAGTPTCLLVFCNCSN